MPLYEVEVKTVSSVYYLIEAQDEDDARARWATGTENGEFVEHEDVVDVIAHDDRFEDDDEQLTDEYEIEQEESFLR